VFVVRPDQGWAGPLKYPAAAPGAPHHLPPLVAFTLRVGDVSTAVFAPVPPSHWPEQGQPGFFAGATAYAAPAPQVIDLLLELLAARPPLRVDAYRDGTSIRLAPTRSGNRLPSRDQVTVTTVAGVSLTDGMRFDDLLPGQVFLRPP